MDSPKRPGALNRFPERTKAQLLAFTHIDGETSRKARVARSSFLKRVRETKPNADGSITVTGGFGVRIRFGKHPQATP